MESFWSIILRRIDFYPEWVLCYSSAWFLWCFFVVFNKENVLHHSLQSNGFSPEWVLWSVLKLEKLFEHSLQWAPILNYSLVFLQVTWMRKCLGTLLAIIRFLSQMSSLVSLLWCPPNPEHAIRHSLDLLGFSPQCALWCVLSDPENAFCDILYKGMASLLNEFIGFGTIMIRRIKWPDLVYNQIVCIRKCLRTLRSMIWLLPWMSSSVFVQTTSMRKCLGTFLTRIWPLSIMSSLVYFELPSLVNVFETFLTR